MSLTPAEKKRLAREARKLAMECVNEAAPDMGTYALRYRNGRPCCVIGHVLDRAGVYAEYLDVFPPSCVFELTAVTHANDLAMEHERHGFLVFPLLALADALDESPGMRRSRHHLISNPAESKGQP